MNLKGKIAVVTGAGGGLGSMLVQALKKEGVFCILVERKLYLLEKLKDLLNADKVAVFECDFSNPSNIEKLVGDIASKFSKIDFLFNVAGIGVYKNIEDLTIDEWQSSLNINLTSAFILTRGLLPLLKRSRNSMVFNFGSGMGVTPTAGRVAYCASKFGLRGFSLSLSKEFKGRGVDFVHFTLGSVMTDFGTGGIKTRKNLEKKGKHYIKPDKVIKKVIEITKSDNRQSEYLMYPEGYEEDKRKI